MRRKRRRFGQARKKMAAGRFQTDPPPFLYDAILVFFTTTLPEKPMQQVYSEPARGETARGPFS